MKLYKIIFLEKLVNWGRYLHGIGVPSEPMIDSEDRRMASVTAVTATPPKAPQGTSDPNVARNVTHIVTHVFSPLNHKVCMNAFEVYDELLLRRTC